MITAKLEGKLSVFNDHIPFKSHLSHCRPACEITGEYNAVSREL